MFNKRRSELQIIEDILNLSRNGAKKTEILYQSNMNFSQLKNYLSVLLKNDILKENIITNNNGKFNKIYTTTKKGNNLLEDINKINLYFE